MRKGDLKYALKYIPLKAEALHDFSKLDMQRCHKNECAHFTILDNQQPLLNCERVCVYVRMRIIVALMMMVMIKRLECNYNFISPPMLNTTFYSLNAHKNVFHDML